MQGATPTGPAGPNGYGGTPAQRGGKGGPGGTQSNNDIDGGWYYSLQSDVVALACEVSALVSVENLGRLLD